MKIMAFSEKHFVPCVNIINQESLEFMITSSLDYLCCPICKGILTFPDSFAHSEIPSNFFCKSCDREYSVNNGYLDFLGDKNVIQGSKREKLMRSLYAKFCTPATDLILIFFGGINKARKEVLSLLELRDNAIVLETGMGPGDNFPLLSASAKNLSIFGIDIQKQMLIHCMRNIRKWKIDAELYRADAEELPFRDEMFDVVFHLGAFNLFANKNKALNEMIRVAKPGARIVIADESEKGNKIFNLLTGNKDAFVLPVDLIPGNMLNIIVRTIWKGYGYVIAFTKPLS